MSTLRILHVGKYYPPAKGGIETVVETLCRGERATVDSRALVINKSSDTVHEVVDDVPVTRVGSVATIGAVSVAPTLPWHLARATADVMVLHEPNPMALVAYAIARPKIPLVVWFHSEVIRPLWRYRVFYQPLLELALGRAARIVVASPPMLEAPALARHRDKCTVVPFGLDPSRYKCTPAIATRVKAIRSRSRTPILLFVGRLVGYKGIDVLLRALPGIDADTIIVGDGPQRLSLTALSYDLGLGERVRFVGEIPDEELQAWYEACDALVLPSITRQEAFGMVQLEAMMRGHPVVCTDLGTGVSWVNQHERTGLVVRPGDAQELRAALSRLIADSELRRQFGKAARARVLDLFTAQQMCGGTVSLYREVTGLSEAAHSEVVVAAGNVVGAGR